MTVSTSKQSTKTRTHLLETALDELVTRQPDVLGRREVLERHLVLVRLLELLARDDLVDDALLPLDDDGGALLHLLLLLLGDLARRLAHLLHVLASLVAPEHVLERGLVEMVVDVVEGVLGDVADDQVGVLPDLATLVGLHVADEELDEGRLAGTVGTEDGDTGREGDLEGDVVELLDGLRGVLEADLAHLEKGLLLGLNTVQERGVGELELVVLSSLESVVERASGTCFMKASRLPL